MALRNAFQQLELAARNLPFPPYQPQIFAVGGGKALLTTMEHQTGAPPTITSLEERRSRSQSARSGAPLIEMLETRRFLSATLLTTDISEADGAAEPNGRLVADGAGNLYGIAALGGGRYGKGNGLIFEIPKGTNKAIALADALPGEDTTYVSGMVIDHAGDLFLAVNGAIDELRAGSHTLRQVILFDGPNGAAPELSFIDPHGNLFGYTAEEGAADSGTVFEIAAHAHAVTTLHSFDGANDDALTALTADAAGNLFGETLRTIFEISAKTHVFTTLDSVGESQLSALVIDPLGNLYFNEVTFAASFGQPNTYRIIKIAAVSQKISVIDRFRVDSRIGYNAFSDSEGNIYLINEVLGGDQRMLEIPASGGMLKTLASFKFDPATSLAIDAQGNVYGTGNDDFDPFEYDPATDVLTMLTPGDADDAVNVNPSPLVFDADGKLHGSFFLGGPDEAGSVFELSGLSSSPVAPRLVIARQPKDSTAGVKMPVSVIVDIEDYTGHVLSDDDSSYVSVAVYSGPGDFATESVLTVKAVHGVARFSGVQLNQPGSYRLIASEITAESVRSHPFVINAGG